MKKIRLTLKGEAPKAIGAPYGPAEVTVEYARGDDIHYPVRLDIGVPGRRAILLERDEVEGLRDALTTALEYDPTSYVQVTVGGSSRRYTYRDPSGTLAVGDYVQVPFGYNDDPRIGLVKALGRGSFTGANVKDVAARFVTVSLTA
jgi:hypothetical protein